MEKKYLVTELNKENKERVKLKAIKLGLSIDELIVSSIDHYSPDIKCNNCENINPTAIYEHRIVVGVNTLTCKVQNTPVLYCKSCSDEETFDVELTNILNRIIEQEMLQSFIRTKKSEFLFDYKELEKMKK